MGDIVLFKSKDEKTSIDRAIENEIAKKEFLRLLKLADQYLQEAEQLMQRYDIEL